MVELHFRGTWLFSIAFCSNLLPFFRRWGILRRLSSTGKTGGALSTHFGASVDSDLRVKETSQPGADPGSLLPGPLRSLGREVWKLDFLCEKRQLRNFGQGAALACRLQGLVASEDSVPIAWDMAESAKP